jgi:predicted nucleic acid-binding protein
VALNVVLDVLQKREPHYRASAAIIDHIVRTDVEAMLPGHAVTTIHYIVSRYSDRVSADRAVDWLLRRFVIAPLGRAELLQARLLGWRDYEDAVVASAAASAGCELIITRNVRDFSNSPVPALTPEEYLVEREDRHSPPPG